MNPLNILKAFWGGLTEHQLPEPEIIKPREVEFPDWMRYDERRHSGFCVGCQWEDEKKCPSYELCGEADRDLK